MKKESKTSSLGLTFLITLYLSLAVLFLMTAMNCGKNAFGEESPHIKFLSPSIKIQFDGRIYELGWTEEIDSGTLKKKQKGKFLTALDSKGNVVQDPKALEKIFFVEYVYRPTFKQGELPIGPVEISGYKKLDEYRLMQQLADTALFLREAGVRALVQAGKIYVTGGTATGASVAEKIAEKTAVHLAKSILTNPANYLKGTISLVFEDAVSRWKGAEALFLKTKGNSILKYEDAKKIHDDLSYGRSYGTESMMFLAKLSLQEGGGGDLLSQLQKVKEYAESEFIAELKGLYKQPPEKTVVTLITIGMFGEKLNKFLVGKVPIYLDYVQNTKSFYRLLHEYRESEYWGNYSKGHIEENIKLASGAETTKTPKQGEYKIVNRLINGAKLPEEVANNFFFYSFHGERNKLSEIVKSGINIKEENGIFVIFDKIVIKDSPNIKWEIVSRWDKIKEGESIILANVIEGDKSASYFFILFKYGDKWKITDAKDLRHFPSPLSPETIPHKMSNVTGLPELFSNQGYRLAIKDSEGYIYLDPTIYDKKSLLTYNLKNDEEFLIIFFAALSCNDYELKSRFETLFSKYDYIHSIFKFPRKGPDYSKIVNMIKENDLNAEMMGLNEFYAEDGFLKLQNYLAKSNNLQKRTFLELVEFICKPSVERPSNFLVKYKMNHDNSKSDLIDSEKKYLAEYNSKIQKMPFFLDADRLPPPQEIRAINGIIFSRGVSEFTQENSVSKANFSILYVKKNVKFYVLKLIWDFELRGIMKERPRSKQE